MGKREAGWSAVPPLSPRLGSGRQRTLHGICISGSTVSLFPTALRPLSNVPDIRHAKDGCECHATCRHVAHCRQCPRCILNFLPLFGGSNERVLESSEVMGSSSSLFVYLKSLVSSRVDLIVLVPYIEERVI